MTEAATQRLGKIFPKNRVGSKSRNTRAGTYLAICVCCMTSGLFLLVFSPVLWLVTSFDFISFHDLDVVMSVFGLLLIITSAHFFDKYDAAKKDAARIRNR